MNPLTQQKIRISSILVMVFQEKPRQGRAGAQSQGGKKSSPTEEGARRLGAIGQFCFSLIACVENLVSSRLKEDGATISGRGAYLPPAGLSTESRHCERPN